MKINKIVKYLILADLAFWSGWGFVTPVFSIFVLEKIVGGSALVVGVATAIYWITKSGLQYPTGLFLDHHKGDHDDYFFLVFGFLVASVIPFSYLLITEPWQLYITQFFFGLGMATSLAGWRAIFTRSIDKGHEATEWSMDDSMLGFGTGITGFVTGYLVYKFGFAPSFIFAGLLGVVSIFFLLFLRENIVGDYRIGIYKDIREIFKIKKNTLK
ncbi:MAG: MFS transporter [Candidatus Pacebacteria bacterium]|nr:MFS transporter [Candidatus Paceibacterota bacterium]